MPEAPLGGADEPNRFSFLPLEQDDMPPVLHTPPVPTNTLKRMADSDDLDKLVDAVAAERFADANPKFHKWAYQRPGADARRANFERKRERLDQFQRHTAFFKTVSGGKETGFRPSLYSTLQQAALCIASVATLGSALNIAANYAIESGAWSSLVEQPWTAFFFVLVAPAGGLAVVFAIAQTLETDHGRKWLEWIVAGLTAIAWLGWLVAFGRLYGLQSVIGDAGGRALPPRVMDEIRDLHAAMLTLQITAEVLSGAALKLLWSRLHWRNIMPVVVPSAVMAFLESRFDFYYRAEREAAGFVGCIDDYTENYRKKLASFTAACQAEMRLLKSATRMHEAAARVEFLTSSHAAAMSSETRKEVEA